ncbi:MAG: hypothetical protein IKN26_04490 [Eubacterium sp.]|nr:hypothetical protein [Eubacterium sp.]
MKNIDDEMRVKPKERKKGKMTFGKFILLLISLIIIALASFLITIKILVPDYDFTQLLPSGAVSVFKHEEETTTEQPLQKTTVKAVPEIETLDYLEYKEFKLDDSKKGNFLGNLLNGGKVGDDYNYIYHIADGKGIYRFSPSTENYSLIYKTDNILSSMNLRGDYIYFVDESSSKLKKLQKGTSKPKTIAENVKFAYVYNNSVYYITNDNSLCIMDVKEHIPTILYNAADNDLQLIGISKKRVFFSVYDGSNLEFLTIDNEAKEKVCRFRETTDYRQNTGFVMENGYLYYIRRDTESGEGHFIVRQKFGSEKTFELAKTNCNIGFPIIDKNRLFYADYKSDKLILKEFNMNSKETKTMLKSDKLSETDGISFYHGGEYDFIIGEKNYKASSNLTSSTNVMKFSKGHWSY